jgi:putative nucleotidyltransferase with HDIG domain
MEEHLGIKIPGVFGSNNTGPLVLLFSNRERLKDILTVGLIQCNYQVIQAQTAFLASIKASQMLPKILIADISQNNPKDILLIARLRKSSRMNHIAIVLILPENPPSMVIQMFNELSEQQDDAKKKIVSLKYPFAFADLLNKLKTLSVNDETAEFNFPQKADVNLNKELNKVVESKLFDMSIKGEAKLQEIGKVLQRHWAFPFTVIKALDIIESDISCCNELAKCISADPSATSAILKISNTIQFAKRHGRITEIRDAVVRLGFRETRSIMACLALIDLSPDIHKNNCFDRREFWLHSLAVAVIAERLASECGFHRPELAFIAGLLHDLGKIPLDNNFTTVFPKLLDDTMVSVNAFYETELRCMGFTHCHLGHYLATQWNFPSSIGSAILNHHSPDIILQTKTPLDKLLQESVFVANILAKAANLGHSCDEILREIPGEMIRDLKLNNGTGDRFFQVVVNQLKVICEFLKLHFKELSIGVPKSENSDAEVRVVLNEKQLYHPVIAALRNNGFHVTVGTQFTEETPENVKVIIAMPEKGLPLDIVFYGDDNEKGSGGHDTLKIFLVDLEQYQDVRHGISDANLIFMDRQNFDLRLLLHTLDSFFGKIITPQNVTGVQQSK